MKKLLSLMLIAVLLCTAAAFACADTDTTTVNCQILSGLDVTTDTFMASGTNRAMLTIISLLEISGADQLSSADAAAFLNGTCYIGNSGSFICMGCIDNSGSCIMVFVDGNDKSKLEYTRLSGVTASIVESSISENCTAHYKISSSDINEAYNILAEIFGTDK